MDPGAEPTEILRLLQELDIPLCLNQRGPYPHSYPPGGASLSCLLLDCSLFWIWDIPVSFLWGSCRHTPRKISCSRWWGTHSRGRGAQALEGLTATMVDGTHRPHGVRMSRPAGNVSGFWEASG